MAACWEKVVPALEEILAQWVWGTKRITKGNYSKLEGVEEVLKQNYISRAMGIQRRKITAEELTKASWLKLYLK